MNATYDISAPPGPVTVPTRPPSPYPIASR